MTAMTQRQIELTTRPITFKGSAAGVAANGLMQTFLPGARR